jgi:hypothetical protein
LVSAANEPAAPLNPDQVTLPVPPILQPGPGVLPVELVGIDADSGADVGERRRLVLSSARPAALTLRLRPRAPLPQEAVIVAHLVTRPASFGREVTVPLDAADWAIGGAYPLEVELPTKTLRYSGVATLRIELAIEDAEPTLIYSQPVEITPLVRPSRLDKTDIEAYFGEGAMRLNYFMRLGPGSDLSVPIDVPQGGSWAVVGIVSALAGDPAVTDLEQVCVMTVSGEENRPIDRAYLRAGSHTAIGDHDAYLPDVVGHERAPIFSSRKTKVTNPRTGEPVENHLYGAWLTSKPLGSGSAQPEFRGDPVSMQLQYLPEKGIIEIHEIVLLPAKNGEL